MKRITLLRHAKSSWADRALDDFDRPLNKRGKRDAPAMGRRLAKRGFLPDLIRSSPARRAILTAEIVAEEIGFPVREIVRENVMYLADVRTLLKLIHGERDEVGHVMLVGHNPGLTDLGNYLLGNETVDNIPTCGILCLDVDTVAWREVVKGSAAMVFFDFPKKPVA